MTEPRLNFSGAIHTHTPFTTNDGSKLVAEEACSTIVIFRRHPMYDCLVLTKKFRPCLNAYCLEFLTTKEQALEVVTSGEASSSSPQVELTPSGPPEPSCKKRLISKILDGDDPIIQCAAAVGSGSPDLSQECPIGLESNLAQQYLAQIEVDENLTLVHVPINGLLNRLENYTNAGLAVDNGVYAFAMGLKTAERLLTTNSIKELQETPL